MRILQILLYSLLTSVTFGQTKKIFGSVRDTTINEKISFATAIIADSSSTTNMDGEFSIHIADYNPKKTYTLNISYVGHQPKSILITDSTKFPLDIVLFNLEYKLYQKPTDLRKYDPAVKLSGFQTTNCGKVYETNLPSKIVSTKNEKNIFELTIKYFESCALTIKPVAKFSSDTLFISLDDKPIRKSDYCGCECCYTTKFVISGLKNADFTVDLEGEILQRQK